MKNIYKSKSQKIYLSVLSLIVFLFVFVFPQQAHAANDVVLNMPGGAAANPGDTIERDLNLTVSNGALPTSVEWIFTYDPTIVSNICVKTDGVTCDEGNAILGSAFTDKGPFNSSFFCMTDDPNTGDALPAGEMYWTASNFTSSPLVTGVIGTLQITLASGTIASYGTISYISMDSYDDLVTPLSISGVDTTLIINQTLSEHTISGTIKYYDGVKVIPNATVTLEDGSSNVLATTTTDSNGLYSFTGVTNGGNYIVVVTKTETSIRGENSADQTKIGRHIVSLETLDSIYKIIAGDVNVDGSLTSGDQTKIGRNIVGLDATLTSGTWKFYSSSVTPTTGNYLNTGLTRTYTNLTADATNQDFVGIKMGDVNNSW